MDCRDDLILTCGATHGLQLILNSFVEPDGVILVEEVTYMIAIAVFREFTGMRVVPVPFSDTGVVASELERVAREEKARRGDRSTGKPFWGVFYSIPVYHNPTGVCTSPEVGVEVVRVAQSLGFLVACDDVYNLLHYGPGIAPRRLASLERSLTPAGAGAGAAGAATLKHVVVSNGSFSKILAPGVRVGWLEAPAHLAHQLRTSVPALLHELMVQLNGVLLVRRGILRSGGGVNSYVAGVICSALQLGLLDRHLDLLLTTLSGRMRALCDALEAALPAGCSVHPARPRGGYFVWLRLPARVDAQALCRYARDTRRVSAFPGSMFSTATPGPGGADADASRHCVRLAIAFHDERRLAAAAADLCAAIDEFIRREGKHESKSSSSLT
ncbi:Aromatic-amino-acid aminotransferase 1 [Frankliniella fusca]|uniref:Aromatic-amino-acid aminotransferase 1 n=1 Tax=Frankliniella fusca TaxID=407009 RepID=A0AAE1H3V9_9NEOP|nr:Aromatic-amino-acid aminotransferase 1 [Frankliniella fusca]